ncbi:MAG: ATP-binding protein [Deltaproteobacteria bacterium]|nr:ATP-binding protein [Deltaproteobacteria bacterium]
MVGRKCQEQIKKSLKKYPVVGILGSRQTGKTTLAGMIQKEMGKKVVSLDLELPSDLNKLRDPELYLGQFEDALVIIDEIQRMPSLFPLIRVLVDKKRVGGRFLILGSASPELIKHASESLAGRIIYHELTPFTLLETGYKDVPGLWLRGGYPESYLSKTDEDSREWRQSFIKTYLERDIPQLGIHIPAAHLGRFWSMLAHMHGQLWNASQLAGSLGISAPTVRRYLDILTETFITRQLQSYYPNMKKRMVKSPKVYIRDSGLLHSLLGIQSMDDLQGHPSLGSSWEGFVIEQVIGSIPKDWEAYFYRTGAGAEIDLVFFDGRKRPVAVEVKYSLSPKISKGFWQAFSDLSCKKGFVVYPGEESYPIDNHISTLPIKEIGRIAEG